jgi:hypothetical protein
VDGHMIDAANVRMAQVIMEQQRRATVATQPSHDRT